MFDVLVISFGLYWLRLYTFFCVYHFWFYKQNLIHEVCHFSFGIFNVGTFSLLEYITTSGVNRWYIYYGQKKREKRPISYFQMEALLPTLSDLQ